MTALSVSRLPGGGPLHRRPSEAVRPLHLLLAWAVPVASTTAFVVIFLVVADPGVLAGVPLVLFVALLGVRPALLEVMRSSRADDVIRYSEGARVTLASTKRGAVVRVRGQRVATLRATASALTEGMLNDRPVALLEEPEDGGRRVVLVGSQRISAVGHRVGRIVDWTLDLDGTVLRMRRHDGVRVLRRTLLEPATGDAWLVHGDPARSTWEAELPTGLPDESAVFCVWLVRHLDGPPRAGTAPGGAVLIPAVPM